jgi:hypothetical protein
MLYVMISFLLIIIYKFFITINLFYFFIISNIIINYFTLYLLKFLYLLIFNYL